MAARSEFLHAATRGGARALRRSGDLGQLVVGAVADLILLDLDTHAFTPLNNLVRQLVYCEDGSSVRTTIVNGDIVWVAGRITTVDERALRAEARALMAPYQAQLADAGDQAALLEPAYRAMLARAAQVPVPMHRRLPPSAMAH